MVAACARFRELFFAQSPPRPKRKEDSFLPEIRSALRSTSSGGKAITNNLGTAYVEPSRLNSVFFGALGSDRAWPATTAGMPAHFCRPNDGRHLRNDRLSRPGARLVRFRDTLRRAPPTKNVIDRRSSHEGQQHRHAERSNN